MHPEDRSKLHTLWQTGPSPSMPVTPQHHGRSRQDQGVGHAPLQLRMSVVSSVPTEHDVPSGCEHLPGAVHTHTQGMCGLTLAISPAGRKCVSWLSSVTHLYLCVQMPVDPYIAAGRWGREEAWRMENP